MAARSHIAAVIRRGLLVAAVMVALAVSSAVISGRLGTPFHTGTSVREVSGVFAAGARFANFGKETPSPEARHVADWATDSRNTAGLDFIIVDKKFARVYVFDADARLRGSAPVLLGAARGDDSVPGIGSRPITEVLPEERTTPAGRFIAERGHNTRGEDVVWVDYDDALSIHRVLTTNPAERRLERLATPTADDNRISYGCINVPTAFYEAYIRPIFAARRAVVYVLPEIKPVQQVFGSYDVAKTHGLAAERSAGAASVN